MTAELLWSGWQGPLRVLVTGLLSYVALVVLLRVSGKRTLAKMNAFDLIVTVALGSSFATVLLSDRVALAEGLTAFAVLIAMQFAVAWASARSERIERVIKSQPTVLVWRGRLLPEALREQRVTARELHAACREAGASSLDEVHAVVLETAGELSVLRAEPGAGSTLRWVAGVPEPAGGPAEPPPPA
jgi:uncharacterized membrane protein YcaP (DUF421 family)